MATRRVRINIPLLVIILLLLALGVATNAYISATVTPEQLARNVLLSALPFITIFVAIVLAFIFFIQFVSSLLSGRIAERAHRTIEAVVIAGILFGVFGIFQPWIFLLYPLGFVVLLTSTLIFILWSHVYPKRVLLHEE